MRVYIGGELGTDGDDELHGGGLPDRERRVASRRPASADVPGHEDPAARATGPRDRSHWEAGQGDVPVSGAQRQRERASHRGTQARR